MKLTMSIPENLSGMGQILIEWAKGASRDFPWRHTTDPYSVLIAEKLLQQTAATDTVVRVFREILQKYPTPKELSGADIDQLEDLVRPLGLTYRARELRSFAIVLATIFDSQVPHDQTLLLTLPGVGHYAARAVLSFAFGEDVGVVDTNVARFLYRIFGLPGPMPKNPARKASLLRMADQMVPPGASKGYNFAVLDLCAQVCLPRHPLCSLCPVKLYCASASSQGVA
jgi:A/G-specific adenine glycosylase